MPWSHEQHETIYTISCKNLSTVFTKIGNLFEVRDYRKNHPKSPKYWDMLGRIVPACLVSAYVLSLHAGIVCADDRMCSQERIRSETTLTLYNDRTEQGIKKGASPPILECSPRSGAMLRSTRRDGVRPTKVVMHGSEVVVRRCWGRAGVRQGTVMCRKRLLLNSW